MEKSNTNIFRIPDNLENIDISKPYIPNKIVTISQEPIGNNQVSKPNHNTELDNVYSEIATIDMLWEGVYRKYISRFSDAYNSGNEYYIGPSLIRFNGHIYKKTKVIYFLKKHFSNHPLAPKYYF
jgi:hypothetical protein